MLLQHALQSGGLGGTLVECQYLDDRASDCSVITLGRPRHALWPSLNNGFADNAVYKHKRVLITYMQNRQPQPVA